MFIECVLLSVSLCHAVKDKPVMALTATHAAAVFADGLTTRQSINRGHYEIWISPLIGKYPTWGRMAPIGAAETLFGMWLAERMHRSHNWTRHIWWMPQSVAIVVHSENAFFNSQLRWLVKTAKNMLALFGVVVAVMLLLSLIAHWRGII
jgi:hypothetical protein